LDFVGPLPITENGNRFILVATEYVSRWPIAKACPNNDSRTVAAFIYDEIICQFGCPKVILTDQATHFRNGLIDWICKILQIKHDYSSPYHPQTNGLTEKFNGTLCSGLKKYCLSKGDDNWDHYINPVLFSYRIRTNSDTGYPPYYLLYGVNPKLPFDFTDVDKLVISDSDEELIEKRIDALQELKLGREVITKLKRRISSKEPPLRYPIGTTVKLLIGSLCSRKDVKLKPKWAGPFIISAHGPHGTYRLKDPKGKIMKKLQSADKVRLYHDRFKEDNFEELNEVVKNFKEGATVVFNNQLEP